MKGRDIACIGPTEWAGVWARPQQLMSRLAARGNRVLYVDPPVTALAPLKVPDQRRRWTAPGSRLTAVGERLWVLEPPLFLPFGSRYRNVNRANQRLLAGALRRVAGFLGFREVILWTYLPGTVDVLDQVPHDLLCYDCVDDHAAFTGLLDPAAVRAMEDELIRRSDVVLASAERLHRRCAALNPAALLVPNGVDFDHFVTATEPGPVPPDLDGLPRPRIGFVGAIGDWIDLELIAAVAKAGLGVPVVLIGPALTDLGPLRRIPNVRILGPRPYKDLPGYLRGFDVCLNPFRLNELTASVNPVKLYEYLAAGKEVVSTALPEVRGFGHVIHIAPDHRSFIETVGAVLAGRLGHPLEAKVAAARANSWDERLARIEPALAL